MVGRCVRHLGLAALIAGFSFLVIFPIGSIGTIFPQLAIIFESLKFLHLGTKNFGSFVQWTGYLVGGSALGFIAGTKLLAKTVSDAIGKVRVIIDIALDVDSWLRESPVGATPRLLIFCRFASLLRHLSAGQYSHIVVVAHSQGTVVASDFFRYLHATKGPLVRNLPPITMFSVGSPLRQLYALRFPVLYHWVRRPQSRNMHGGGPSPTECGFAHWINAYGSADYIGRYLWKDDEDPARCEPGAMRQGQYSSPSHYEFCVGPAAHTHYLDANNTLVGECLHTLI
jgi:hypothetical protein